MWAHLSLLKAIGWSWPMWLQCSTFVQMLSALTKSCPSARFLLFRTLVPFDLDPGDLWLYHASLTSSELTSSNYFWQMDRPKAMHTSMGPPCITTGGLNDSISKQTHLLGQVIKADRKTENIFWKWCTVIVEPDGTDYENIFSDRVYWV